LTRLLLAQIDHKSQQLLAALNVFALQNRTDFYNAFFKIVDFNLRFRCRALDSLRRTVLETGADIGIAPEDASEEAKAAADRIAPPCREPIVPWILREIL